jgi:hypothetical protein
LRCTSENDLVFDTGDACRIRAERLIDLFHDVRENLRLPKLPAVIAESGENNVDQFLDKLDKLNLTKNTVIILICANSAF